MNELWGISGPAFLWLYGGLLLVPILVRFGWAALATRRAPAADNARPLTVYELAYLAGGPDRAVDTAVAALVERGALRVSSTAKKVLATGETPADRLEQHVVANVGDNGSSTSSLRIRVRPAKALKALGAGLQARGLVLEPERLKLIRRTVVGLYLVLIVLGCARWVGGVSAKHPVAYLVALIVVAVIATIIAWRRAGRSDHGMLTRAGRRMLGDAEKQRKGASPTGTLLAGAAGAVALGGLVMYPDDELAGALLPMHAQNVAWGGSGNSTGGYTCSFSSSGGSSCSGGGGGSSCGGGGGGGGGGCGG
ncbi:TIGR04222 domain-containing membrane protein [Amycolatopsis sp. H20-H5]|uniref:TIGR04222 domain-containing membrane protein n=1 Tax=Amycolatopsis sp. H20-H5 TaxID=3046309 RepID=UPI002DBCB258|nr:TIGR04222 domain-containing membrane protein [Amycolatopsis sp. H20-H5]MEC3981568.1 TIGR04222 domain-containing membrane protein [Amycolatopsis sp. H20-H5]